VFAPIFLIGGELIVCSAEYANVMCLGAPTLATGLAVIVFEPGAGGAAAALMVDPATLQAVSCGDGAAGRIRDPRGAG
jgi:hypothetical protein